MEKLKKHNFLKNVLSKFVFHKNKKGESLRFNREPTSQTWWESYDEYFVFGSLHLDERVRKNAHFVLIIGNHFIDVISWQVNTFSGVFPHGKHYSQTRNIESSQTQF